MSLTILAEIGIKALQVQALVDTRKAIAKKFTEACFRWKQSNGYEYIQRHSPEWSAMLTGIDAEYRAIKRAKADEANARKRLERVCRKASKAAK